MWSLIVVVCLAMVASGQAQQIHKLKYISAGTSQSAASIAAPQFTSAMPEAELRNTKNKFAKADRICVVGMWALYTTPDYGEGAEESTNVIAVRGTDIYTCVFLPGIRFVRSVRPLGNTDFSEDGVRVFSEADYLGGMWLANVSEGGALPPPGITGFPLGSIAVTGSTSWVLCSDFDTPCTNGVCIDMRKYDKLFFLNNTTSIDSGLVSGSSGWPKTIRQIHAVSGEDCANYPSPLPPPPPMADPSKKKPSRNVTITISPQ